MAAERQRASAAVGFAMNSHCRGSGSGRGGFCRAAAAGGLGRQCQALLAHQREGSAVGVWGGTEGCPSIRILSQALSGPERSARQAVAFVRVVAWLLSVRQRVTVSLPEGNLNSTQPVSSLACPSAV